MDSFFERQEPSAIFLEMYTWRNIGPAQLNLMFFYITSYFRAEPNQYYSCMLSLTAFVLQDMRHLFIGRRYYCILPLFCKIFRLHFFCNFFSLLIFTSFLLVLHSKRKKIQEICQDLVSFLLRLYLIILLSLIHFGHVSVLLIQTNL